MCSKFKYAPMFQLGPDTTEYYKIPGSEKLVKTTKYMPSHEICCRIMLIKMFCCHHVKSPTK